MDADKVKGYQSYRGISDTTNASAFGPNFDWSKFEQTQKLQDEVEVLRKQLQEKSDENEKLSDAVITLTRELEIAETQDSQADVAKSLARKNKEWRLLAQKKDAEVVRLRAQLKKLNDAGKTEKKGSKGKSQDAKDVEITRLKSETKEWKDRYKSVSMTHVNHRKEISKLKAQMKRAKSILAMEIGDEKLVQQLLDSKIDKAGPKRWRGRAQQIALLQSKLRELRKKKQDESRQNLKPSQRPSSRIKTVQDRAEATVHQSAQSRRLMEQLGKEKAKSEKLNDDFEQLRKKAEATKARCRVLEKNVRSMRDQIKILLSKSDNDDKLIDDLKAQCHFNAKGKVKVKSGPAHNYEAQLKERERQLARQCQIIAKLEADLENLKS